MGERAKFATKLGVIATTVGSAVGLGNIWRFPYEAKYERRGAFLMIYILCVLILGVPVMCADYWKKIQIRHGRRIQKINPRQSMVLHRIYRNIGLDSYFRILYGHIGLDARISFSSSL